MTRPFTLSNAPLLGMAALAALGLAAAPAHAQVTTYSSASAFQSAFPNLPVETFEAANVSPGGIEDMTNPLDKNTNNAIFAAGSIQDGLSIFATGPVTGTNYDLAVTGAGFNGYASKAVYDNYFADGLTVSFTNGNVHDVGLDLISYQGAGQQTVTAYDGTTVLGTYVETVDPTGTFFGLSSLGGPITSLAITGDSNHTRGVDNIAFGNSAPVPEASSVFGVGFGLLGFAVLAFKSRKKASAAA